MWNLAMAIYHKIAEWEKRLYEKSIMALIGSKKLFKVRVVHAHDVPRQAMELILFLLLFSPLYYLAQQIADGALVFSEAQLTMIKIVVQVYQYTLLAMYFFNWEVVETILFGYKKSSYYQATKERRRDIYKDAGLIGEFKSYVLTRTLKIPYKVLHNLCIPMPNGNFQEIDTVILTNNIIYVVECKNRGGGFYGTYDSPIWTQRIGRQVYETENIYLQNQKHTMALDRFLLEKGLIQNGESVCLNAVFTTGEMTMPKEGAPLDFLFGDARALRRYIERNEKRYDDGTDTSEKMHRIYEALLPYALYTKEERKAMMQVRQTRSQNKEFALGEFQYRQNGDDLIRYNRVYTQVQLTDSKKQCWQTRTDLGGSTGYASNQISRGVSRERVDEYKRLVEKNEPRLWMDKAIKLAWIVSFVVIVFSAKMWTLFMNL